MSVGRHFSPSGRRHIAALLILAAQLPWAAIAASAEDKAAKKQQTEAPPRPEKPVQLMVPTSDGLELAMTYYPGSEGKRTIPVVLLHMWKQSRNDYKDLAPALQAMGCAVIVPDLRGHGESTHRKGERLDETLKAATMRPEQFARMVTQDMAAVERFLWERNNAGELNIDKLCVVGAEMGAAVAVNFAWSDAVAQDRNPVRRADYRIGRFVKAMVLISPELSFHGLSIRTATAHPAVQRDIATMIVVGKQDVKTLEEAKRIYGLFERHHTEPAGDYNEKAERGTLFLLLVDAKLQGTKLLDPRLGVHIELYTRAEGARKYSPNVTVQSLIADFIYRRLLKSEESKDWTWQARKLPHG